MIVMSVAKNEGNQEQMVWGDSCFLVYKHKRKPSNALVVTAKVVGYSTVTFLDKLGLWVLFEIVTW